MSESYNEGKDERSGVHGGVFQLHKATYTTTHTRMGGETHNAHGAWLRGHGGESKVHGETKALNCFMHTSDQAAPLDRSSQKRM